MRILATKYDVISGLMQDNGINTKELEALLFNEIKVPHQGDMLPNENLIISKCNVNDKQNKIKQKEPAIAAFANTNGEYFKAFLKNLML